MKKNIILKVFIALITLSLSCKKNHPPKTDHPTECTQGFPAIIWAKNVSEHYTVLDPFNIAFNNAGHLVLNGRFIETHDFDPGPGVNNLTAGAYPGNDWAEEIDTAGNYLTATLGENFNVPIVPYGAVSRIKDASGNNYTTGTLNSTDDFDPGPAVFNLTYTGVEDEDFYVPRGFYIRKMDAAGNFKWAILSGLIDYREDRSFTIAVDAEGNVYTAGHGPGLTNKGMGYYLQKFNNNGELVWEQKTERHNDVAMALDPTGNIYTLSADENAVAKYNSTGTLIAEIPITVSGITAPSFITTDASGSLYIGGIILTDYYIQKNDASGNLKWLIKSKGTVLPGEPTGSFNRISGLVVDPSTTYIYAVGLYSGEVNFNPGSGTTKLTSSNKDDARLFLVKYRQCN